MRKHSKHFCLFGGLVFVAMAFAEDTSLLKDYVIQENFGYIFARASAPIPPEVPDNTQAKALSREAAIVIGQTRLLNHILQKKTRSKKTLAEAEVPSLNLQKTVRGFIMGAAVMETRWEEGKCRVTLRLSKRQLKEILRRN
ncbi:MAG: hypothetical protein LHV69_03830 [Elusimicrobia bacterium]|nr:hypothetical protein [Candidatus Obscuribacterium magneticum]